MPRPGPRLYECVRRAWHSERHQPIRGLIIQQIFRLVHDNHSAATKKNKEWQDNLPIVVLKAEEIMYAKANSEAEYSDIDTLWDRVNDAIDKIIRKDESVETRELLPPCVEAALNLGCIPIRASRSQRYNNPQTYLRPNQECNKIRQNVDSSRLGWECKNRITPNPNRGIVHSVGNTHGVEMDHNAPLRSASVYPLYYGSSFNQMGFHEAQRPDSVIIGVPVFSSADTTSQGGCLQNLFPDTSFGIKTFEDKKGKGPLDFDLSLRLGMFSDSNLSLPIEKEFSFFPTVNEESENRNAELFSRKRKLPFSRDIGSDQFFCSRARMRRHG